MSALNRILLVDDDPSLLETTKDVLVSVGYAVKTARTGAEAVTLAGADPYDVIIIDISTTSPTGIETARALRKLRPNPPIAVLSAGRRRGESDAVRRVGAVFLLKPCEPALLLRFIEQSLHQPRVLVVDDDENLAEMLGRALAREGFETMTALNLDRGRMMIADRSPDAILLDLRLKDGSGLELLRDDRVIDRQPLVILLTGFLGDFRKDVDRALQSQAYLCLEKPCKPKTIASALRRGLFEKADLAIQNDVK